jgi:hypothetical protein
VNIGGALCDLHTPDQDVDTETPGSTFQCIVGNHPVGYTNASVDLIPWGFDQKPAYFVGGNAINVNPAGTVYHFQYVPSNKHAFCSCLRFVEIESVSHSFGSTEGGLTLAVKGVGFGSDIEDVAIDIDGAPCEVTEVSNEIVYCVTKPSNGPSASGFYLVWLCCRLPDFVGRQRRY